MEGHLFILPLIYGHLNVIDRLVELGASVYEKTMNGITPLHLASNKGHLDAVSRLVELGASVYEKANHGLTSLHIASLNGHLDVVVLFLRLITPEEFDDQFIFHLLKSKETMLALLAYGFNQPVSESVLQWLSSDMRDLYHRMHLLCPLQVDLDSLFFEGMPKGSKIFDESLDALFLYD